jgi:hypothetical protein
VIEIERPVGEKYPWVPDCARCGADLPGGEETATGLCEACADLVARADAEDDARSAAERAADDAARGEAADEARRAAEYDADDLEEGR